MGVRMGRAVGEWPEMSGARVDVPSTSGIADSFLTGFQFLAGFLELTYNETMHSFTKFLTAFFYSVFALWYVSNMYHGYPLTPWESDSVFEALAIFGIWISFFTLVILVLHHVQQTLLFPWFDFSSIIVPFTGFELFWRYNDRIDWPIDYSEVWDLMKYLSIEIYDASPFIALLGLFALVCKMRKPRNLEEV